MSKEQIGLIWIAGALIFVHCLAAYFGLNYPGGSIGLLRGGIGLCLMLFLIGLGMVYTAHNHKLLWAIWPAVTLVAFVWLQQAWQAIRTMR